MNDPAAPEALGYTADMVGAESILLVDDTYVLRDRLALAMQQRGLRVETAGNYPEAVEVFRSRPTDLAVLDLRMPGRSGLELLRKLLELKPDARIIMLSGFGSIPASIDAVRAGAVNFLSKPADADDILGAFVRGERPSVPDGGDGVSRPVAGEKRVGAHPPRPLRLQRQHQRGGPPARDSPPFAATKAPQTGPRRSGDSRRD